MQCRDRIRPFRINVRLGIFMIAALVVLAPRAAAADAPITVETLLRKMGDTRWLAVPPQAGERTVQFSSYDRASRLEDGKIDPPLRQRRPRPLPARRGGGRPAGMGAGRGRRAPATCRGSGVRNPDGELRIYIDGGTTPALAAPFAAITNGEIKPFAAPFGHDASRGRNLYFPFPFAKSIKITHDQGGPVLPGERDDLARGDEGRELFARGARSGQPRASRRPAARCCDPAGLPGEPEWRSELRR